MKEYELTSPEGVTYTAQLDDETAKRVGAKAAPAPANKAVSKTANKAVK